MMMRGGIIYYLCRQNKGRGGEHDLLAGFEPRTYSMSTALYVRVRKTEKDSLDHSATGHYI